MLSALSLLSWFVNDEWFSNILYLSPFSLLSQKFCHHLQIFNPKSCHQLTLYLLVMTRKEQIQSKGEALASLMVSPFKAQSKMVDVLQGKSITRAMLWVHRVMKDMQFAPSLLILILGRCYISQVSKAEPKKKRKS